MPAFTSYAADTGAISRNHVAADLDEAHANAAADHKTVEGFYSASTHYFVADVPTLKGVIEPTISGAVLSGLPDPCTVQVDGGAALIVTGGSFTVTGRPGMRIVRINALPFRERLLGIAI